MSSNVPREQRTFLAVSAALLLGAVLVNAQAVGVGSAVAAADKTPGTPVAQGNLIDTLREAGAKRYLELVEAADATKPLREYTGPATVFAPSDAALDAYLKYSGLTMADLRARPQYANRLVGYSIALSSDQGIKSLKPGGKSFLPTLAGDWAITVVKGAGGDLTVYDSEGDSAVVKVSQHQQEGYKQRVVVVEKVLLPGNIFGDFDDLKFDVVEPGTQNVVTQRRFDVLEAAIARAGLGGLRTADKTLFAPTDAAFNAMGVTEALVKKLPPKALKQLLEYHLLAGYRTIPRRLPNGKPVATELTLPNGKPADVTVTYKVSKDKDGVALGAASVKDALGRQFEVVAPNFFYGKLTIHAIDGVLLPSNELKAVLTAAVAAAAKPSGGNRKMLQYYENRAYRAMASSMDARLAAMRFKDDDSMGFGDETYNAVYYPSRGFLYNN